MTSPQSTASTRAALAELFSCIGAGDIGTAKALLDSKPVNGKRALLSETNAAGVTLLQHASHVGHADGVCMLLDQGADPSWTSTKGSTPLHFACNAGHYDCAVRLLDHGVDVNAGNANGSTPLLIAAFGAHANCVRLLLKHGADPNIRDKLGRRAGDSLCGLSGGTPGKGAPEHEPFLETRALLAAARAIREHEESVRDNEVDEVSEVNKKIILGSGSMQVRGRKGSEGNARTTANGQTSMSSAFFFRGQLPAGKTLRASSLEALSPGTEATTDPNTSVVNTAATSSPTRSPQTRASSLQSSPCSPMSLGKSSASGPASAPPELDHPQRLSSTRRRQVGDVGASSTSIADPVLLSDPSTSDTGQRTLTTVGDIVPSDSGVLELPSPVAVNAGQALARATVFPGPSPGTTTPVPLFAIRDAEDGGGEGIKERRASQEVMEEGHDDRHAPPTRSLPGLIHSRRINNTRFGSPLRHASNQRRGLELRLGSPLRMRPPSAKTAKSHGGSLLASSGEACHLARERPHIQEDCKTDPPEETNAAMAEAEQIVEDGVHTSLAASAARTRGAAAGTSSEEDSDGGRNQGLAVDAQSREEQELEAELRAARRGSCYRDGRVQRSRTNANKRQRAATSSASSLRTSPANNRDQRPGATHSDSKGVSRGGACLDDEMTPALRNEVRRLRAEAAALGREHASLAAKHATLVLEKARQAGVLRNRVVNADSEVGRLSRELREAQTKLEIQARETEQLRREAQGHQGLLHTRSQTLQEALHRLEDIGVALARERSLNSSRCTDVISEAQETPPDELREEGPGVVAGNGAVVGGVRRRVNQNAGGRTTPVDAASIGDRSMENTTRRDLSDDERTTNGNGSSNRRGNSNGDTGLARDNSHGDSIGNGDDDRREGTADSSLEEDAPGMSVDVGSERDSAAGDEDVVVVDPPAETASSLDGDNVREVSAAEGVSDGQEAVVLEGSSLMRDVDMHSSRGMARASHSAFSGSNAGTPHEGELAMARIFSHQQIDAACEGFPESAIVGRGGFGPVFRGNFLGEEVAVKRLDGYGLQGLPNFLREVQVLTTCRHEHLVPLLGICVDPTPMLVYPFVGQSLEWHLREPNRRAALGWRTRLAVAVAVSKGLQYLHQPQAGAWGKPVIVHRDVKTENILMDTNLRARLSDVGIARSLERGRVGASTRLVGTWGYIDPEYQETGVLTPSSDIFSLGVVFLELLTGLPAHEAQPGPSSLVDRVNGKQLSECLDQSVPWPDTAAVVSFATEAWQCVSRRGYDRPCLPHLIERMERLDVGDESSNNSAGANSTERRPRSNEIVDNTRNCVETTRTTSPNGNGSGDSATPSSVEPHEASPRPAMSMAMRSSSSTPFAPLQSTSEAASAAARAATEAAAAARAATMAAATAAAAAATAVARDRAAASVAAQGSGEDLEGRSQAGRVGGAAAYVLQPTAPPLPPPRGRDCMICASAPVQTRFLPCRHSLACRSCASLLRARGDLCPVDRTRIEGVESGHFQVTYSGD